MLNDWVMSWALGQTITAIKRDDGLAVLVFGALFLSCVDTKLKER
jgi:hypothetical protein